jgi:hypothetical protein
LLRVAQLTKVDNEMLKGVTKDLDKVDMSAAQVESQVRSLLEHCTKSGLTEQQACKVIVTYAVPCIREGKIDQGMLHAKLKLSQELLPHP